MNPPDDDSAIMDPHEDVEWRPAREILRRLGYEVAPVESIDDLQIRGKLWELLYALAARRIYLYSTGHLSDRDLYAWLDHYWINKDTADLPPSSEWNTRIGPVSGSGDPEEMQVWLQYYADEEERRLWAERFPEDEMPAHQDLLCDRDRFLPQPPIPRTQWGGTGGIPMEWLDDSEAEDEEDPLSLKDVDEEIRKSREAEEDEDDSFIPMEPNVPEPYPDPVPQENWQAPLRVLHREGVILLPPDELTDETIGSKLWELLHELACRGFYVLHTNHFTDRELYTSLWRENLREPALLPGRSRTGGWFHDFLGSWDDEAIQLELRYYATEEKRQQYAIEYPNIKQPPSETPPANRDWRTPKGPFD